MEDSPDSGKVHDVIIVGAGISGMSAAKLLHEEGQDVLVLEARDRLGGRLYTYKGPETPYSDMGGSYIGPTQNRIFRLATELGVRSYKVNMKERTILIAAGSKWVFEGMIPVIYNPIVALDLNYLVRKINDFVDTVPMANPWECANAKEWDSMTAKEWFDKICWCQSTKNTAAILTRTIYAVEPEDVSFLYFLWYLKVGHGFLRVMQTEDGAQERKFEGGSQQICQKIADLIGKEKVVCNSPVIKLEQSEDGVIVRTSDGSTYQAKHVISALAPTLLGRIAFSPPLPPLKTQLIQRFPMGSVIKAILFYENSYWSENGYNGTVGSDVILPSACDDTKPDGSYPAIVAFINGKHAREMTQLTKDERKRILCEFFAEIFESDEALRPVNYVEKNWLTEEFSGGCYVGVTPPGVLTQFGPVLREPYGRIYFAGTETATEWTGYMEGGVQAGERAAREVLHAVGKISKDEIWQDEPVSPDLPVMPLITTKWEKVLPSVPAFINFTIFSAILCAGAIVVVKKPSLFDAIKTSLTNIATLQL